MIAVLVGAGSVAYAMSNQFVNMLGQRLDITITEASILKTGVIHMEDGHPDVDQRLCFINIGLVNSGSFDFTDLSISATKGLETPIQFVIEDSLVKEFKQGEAIEILNPPYIDPLNPSDPPIEFGTAGYCDAWIDCENYPLTVIGSARESTATAVGALTCDQGQGAA